MKAFILFITLIIHALSQFTLSNTGKKLSSYETLAPNVNYELNFTLNKVITSGSTVTITFPTEFRIPPTALSSCQASRISSVAPTSATCSSVYSSGLDVYSIVFSGLYTSSTTQTFLWLKVLC